MCGDKCIVSLTDNCKVTDNIFTCTLLGVLVPRNSWRIQSSNAIRVQLLAPIFYQYIWETNKCMAPPSAHIKTICLNFSCLCCAWTVQQSLFTSIFSNSPLMKPPTSLTLPAIWWIYHPLILFSQELSLHHIHIYIHIYIAFYCVTLYSILETTYTLSIFKRCIIFNSE